MTVKDDTIAAFRASVEALARKIAHPRTTSTERLALKQEQDAIFAKWQLVIDDNLARNTAALNLLVGELRRIVGGVVTNPADALHQELNQAIDQGIAALRKAATEVANSAFTVPDAAAGEQEAIEAPRAQGAGDGTPPPADEAADPAPATADRPAVPADLLLVQQPGSPVPAGLFKEYAGLFASCLLRPQAEAAVVAAARKARNGKARYDAVAAATGVPWWTIGLIHGLECGYDFERHLHNGDPLTARTVRVPKGRPATGAPKFAWEDSARDALTHDHMAGWTDWTVPAVLYKLERYNGWGYRKYHPEVLSPYLWSFTNHYTKGKYVEDGKFNAEAVSKQVGAAAILRQMANDGALA